MENIKELEKKFEEYLKSNEVISERRIIYLENDYSRGKVMDFILNYASQVLKEVLPEEERGTQTGEMGCGLKVGWNSCLAKIKSKVKELGIIIN